MTNLRDINFGLNQYCGPAVLSAMTGKTTDECAAVISAVSGQREIRAVQTSHLLEAFRRLRFDVVKVEDALAHTLFGTLSQLSTRPGLYIILVPGHVVAVEIAADNQIFFIDNHTKQAIDARGSARLGQRVVGVYHVSDRGQPEFIKNEIELTTSGQMVYIKCVSLHKNPEDNITVSLGQIRFRTVTERTAIIDALIENYMP